MTDLNVTLSATLQTKLDEPGVWAYAVYFDSSGNPSWTNLVENGTVQSSGSVSIALPEPFVGGKIYFLVQSQASSQPNDLTTLITQQSDINWSNADSWDFRYDSFEVTLQNGIDDDGNLTSVNGFGLPMEVSVTYDDSTTSTVGYNITATDLFTKLAAIGDGTTVDTYGSGPLSGNNRAAISPSEALAQNPANTAFQASDWNSYVDSLKVDDTNIQITGYFNGAADANGVWHNAGFFSFTLEWDSTDDVFWLSPSANSAIQGYIRITPDDLANSIYSTLGNVGIYTNKTDSEPYQIFNHADMGGDDSMNTGENNQWGEVLTQFLTGFTAGFYGTEGKQFNSEATGTIDLDKNWNWDPSYAFGENLSGSTAIYQDPYSEVFYLNSNSYGSGYSDNLMRNYAIGGPLISVSEPGQAQNVSTIDLTIYADGETPSGYEMPVIYNYIAAGADGYETPLTSGSTSTVKLNFANAGMVLAEGTTITLDIYDGEDGNGDPKWQTVTFDAPPGTSPWQAWTISYADGSYTATLQPDTSQGSGQLLMTNFPTSESGTTWYRINVGSGDTLKTFNLYTETSGQAFENPNYSGQAGHLAVDGLATISPYDVDTETIPTFTINFLYTDTVTVHPDLLTVDLTYDYPTTPSAPVAGTMNGTTFDALSGQDNLETNSASTTSAETAFGWTGYNSATGTTSWISAYTNKVGAQNFAQINFSQAGMAALAPISVQADIDGQWLTSSTPLGNGTYTVTMKEYLSSDPTLTTPVNQESNALTLTVNTEEMDLTANGDGIRLSGDGIDDPAGNWVTLETTGSFVSAGTTVLLYLTDADGNLVDARTGETGSGIDLDDAVVAAIGAAHADDNGQMLLGKQTVYLPTDLELHFAVLEGDEPADIDAHVCISNGAGETLEIAVGGYRLLADIDNTLSDDAVLASAQRVTGDTFVFLEEGSAYDIDIAGSCANTNTLAFVRMDIDAFTGEWSVDGVAYGDTDEFRAAVVDSLDDGFLFSQGGEFETTTTWAIEGESGFYAPVLITQNGDVFVIGDANSGNNEYIRSYGHNTFGFEDLTEDQGSDFDYNDMVLTISPSDTIIDTTGDWLI